MKMIRRLSLLFFFFPAAGNLQAQTFTLISKSTGSINKAVVKKLSPSLRAMAAFYSAVGGTKCKQNTCQLTTALGLGAQGSNDQISLIKKYFPGDKVANMVCEQNCYLPPDSSAAFSNFLFLSFVVAGEKIEVNYDLAVYEHGHSRIISGPDIYTYHNHIFSEKKRVLYAWIDK